MYMLLVLLLVERLSLATNDDSIKYNYSYRVHNYHLSLAHDSISDLQQRQ